jgi:hypothetical protein
VWDGDNAAGSTLSPSEARTRAEMMDA